MKKFVGYAVVFIIGVSHGRMVERIRNLNTINEVKIESAKKYADRMDRFLSEEL